MQGNLSITKVATKLFIFVLMTKIFLKNFLIGNLRFCANNKIYKCKHKFTTNFIL